MDQRLSALWQDQVAVMQAAAAVLEESRSRVAAFAKRLGRPLSVGEREPCEALTARFARLNDLLVQRLFRTLDQLELTDEGSIIDRLHRMEKRGIIASAERWRELRLLRNAILHDYLIESADEVLRDALAAAPEQLDAVARLQDYANAKGYGGSS